MTDTDQSLLEAFETYTIDAKSFGHRDHLRVAFMMLEKYDFLEATYRYSRTIQKLANAAGAPAKFNTTITIAFMGMIAERMADKECGTADDFLDSNPDLITSKTLRNHYSESRINSDLARTAFLLPDRGITARA